MEAPKWYDDSQGHNPFDSDVVYQVEGDVMADFWWAVQRLYDETRTLTGDQRRDLANYLEPKFQRVIGKRRNEANALP
jgi:hypothetical protein